ncbi:MAG TPA: glycosyltransferase, partial [Streptosporangiaceae bacterium]|nr:glycosyltransferase [Streptosporangiaceae bacterium]
MVLLVAACVLAAAAWVYLVAGHGWFWRTDVRLPVRAGAAGPVAGAWPSVVAVVPARDEAAILAETLPTLLRQDYPGAFSVVLVDDASTDGTGAVAAAVSSGRSGPPASGDFPGGAVVTRAGAVRVVSGSPPPAGWAGKVWAMAQG